MLVAIVFKKKNDCHSPEGAADGSQGLSASETPGTMSTRRRIPKGCERSIVVTMPISHPFGMRKNIALVSRGCAALAPGYLLSPLRGEKRKILFLEGYRNNEEGLSPED